MQEAATQNTEAVTEEEEEETEDILRGQKGISRGNRYGNCRYSDTGRKTGTGVCGSSDRSSTDGGTYRKPGQEVWTGYKPEEICAYIAAHPEHKNVAIALSGDVGFYSGAKKLLETLHRELPMVQKKVYCGISSMIYFCAKTGTTVGRCSSGQPSWKRVQSARTSAYIRKDFCYCGKRQTASQNCVRSCSATGMGDVRVEVGERLSYPEEKITRGYAWQLTELETDSLSVVLFTREGKKPS